MSTFSPPIGQQHFLDSSTQTVSWFESRLRDNELQLKPPFQRNPVWVDTQKSYLMDTILRGFPIPEIYLQARPTPEGRDNFVVVDGQQRIRACLEFLNGDYALQLDGRDWDGLSFEDLEPEERSRVRSYRFVVRMLPPVDDDLLREIFGRLNRNNMSLNKQELRQATYWGEFISTVNKLAEHPFWVNSGLFTANDIRRMLDREYVSELILCILFGPQNKKTSLDRYYVDFEEDFPRKSFVEVMFDRVLNELEVLFEGWSHWNRWSKKSDFYTLFGVLSRLAAQSSLSDDRGVFGERLLDFARLVDDVLSLGEDATRVGGDNPAVLAYARAVQRAASDLANRRVRAAALESFLRGTTYEPPAQPRGASHPLPDIPSAPPMVVTEEDDDEDEG